MNCFICLSCMVDASMCALWTEHVILRILVSVRCVHVHLLGILNLNRRMFYLGSYFGGFVVQALGGSICSELTDRQGVSHAKWAKVCATCQQGRKEKDEGAISDIPLLQALLWGLTFGQEALPRGSDISQQHLPGDQVFNMWVSGHIKSKLQHWQCWGTGNTNGVRTSSFTHTVLRIFQFCIMRFH